MQGPYHCVQCGREMKYVCDVQEKQVPACNYPDCPNFGLLQLGIEIMSDFIPEKEYATNNKETNS